jgi:hypothetical protein
MSESTAKTGWSGNTIVDTNQVIYKRTITQLREVAEAARIVQDQCHSSHPMTSCPRCMHLHDLLAKLPSAESAV